MDDLENENEHKRPKDRSPSPAIKSTAVVKYTAFQSPVGYARLQCNTDLNLPPSNWGAAIDSYGLKQILTRDTGMSSFRMAHMFPDCVGEVDVISGSECIKELLKLPYQPNGTVSMMVHRVENTLLLDDFDVYDYLMKSEWSWLKDFFYENIVKTMSEQERMGLSLTPARRSALQLTHKFLSHSVAHPAPAREGPVQPICIAGPFLPEPETRQDPPNDHLYNRNVLWTFEDIHMLIGSDLPIFGDKDRPCVSLRLRDAREPINVLTGIDYWLDNLMCNVPEVLMCYHIDGIVQKYEPMKTEDLPNMENSKFSPKVIRNVAQNILSFLKSNATKAGHTYWLFKGPHDDVVKLYDLTSLCPDSLDNPFTTPVAMLLYRVARNMRLTNRSKHVRQLLEHVIELLKVERHPQIVASSHYMLADLYVPATVNPACPNFKDESSDDEGDVEFNEEPPETENADSNEGDAKCDGDEASANKEDNEGEGDSADALAVQIRGLELSNIGNRLRDAGTDAKSKRDASKGLGVDPPGRCGRALQHALKGLLALHNVTIDKCKEEERERLKQQIIVEEQHPKMANPYEPIKMNYEPITNKQDTKEHVSRSRRRKRERKESNVSGNFLIETPQNIDKNAILIRKEKKSFPSWHEPSRDDNFAWKLHLKTLLYEKICLAYATLAEYSYANEQYGFSLKYIDMASKCQKLLSHMIIKSRVVDASCLIGRVGDNYFQLSKHWHRLSQFKKQFETDHDVDSKLRLEIEHDMTEEVDGKAGDEFDLGEFYISSLETDHDVDSKLRLEKEHDMTEEVDGKAGDEFDLGEFYISSLETDHDVDSKLRLEIEHDMTEEVDGKAGDEFDLGEFYISSLETDHDVDSKLRLEIEHDMTEEVDGKAGDEFDLDITLPTSEVQAMLMSCSHYRCGVAVAGDKRSELQRRLASVNNELAVRYMNDAQQIYVKYLEESDQKDPKAKLLLKQFATISRRSLECLDEATEIFERVNDVPNLALLFCNKGRYMRFKAHCSQGDFNSEKRSYYRQAEDLYQAALKLLGPKESCGAASVWELVSWELSCHLYTRAVLLQDSAHPTPEVSEVAEAFKHALKYCLLSPGPRQYLYQFRAAMIYHRLGSLYHSQYRITSEDGPKRRTLLNLTRSNYEQASNMFARLEDASMFVTVQLEHVAVLETQTDVSPNLKLKSLQSAIQLLRQCHSIMKLIQDRDPEEQKEQTKSEDTDEKSLKSEYSLLALYENRLHYILKSIIQYCRSKTNKDYEKITELYKKLYCASLRIKKSDDVRLYARSICEVLQAMDEISGQFE